MVINNKKIAIILGIVLFVLGFILGRLTSTPETVVKTEERIEYIPSTTVIRDTIKKDKLVPYDVFVRDTITQYLVQEVDTAAILRDYYLSRKYALDFSNDTIGIFRVDAEVNQNKLVYASSFINPITKTVIQEKTLYRAPTIQFYGMLGTSVDFKTNKISLGVDLKQRYLIGVSGMRFDDKYNYTIDFGVKF